MIHFATSAHPRVFARADQREALLEKIRTAPWAQKIYVDLKSQVDPLVVRHATDPAWIVSRLQMHWEDGSHYTDFYSTAGSGPIVRREGNAPYPTVRLAHCGWGPSPLFPGKIPLERIEPYGNGSLWYQKGEAWEFFPFEKTGLLAEQVNQTILEYAYQASIVYFLTGDPAYAKFAADILWTFIRGASYQNQLDPKDRSNRYWLGFLALETIGDTRRYTSVPLTYDFIHDYLETDYFDSDVFRDGIPGERWAPPQPGGKAWAHERLVAMFQKYIDNKILRGSGARCNWNLIEQESAMLYALALEDDAAIPDGRGRGHYVERMLYGPSTSGHAPLVDVAHVFDEETGLWPEPPGSYGQACTGMVAAFCFWYYQNGIDVFERIPRLRKAVFGLRNVVFPNGRTTATGDSGSATLGQGMVENLIAYARAKGDTVTERDFAALLTQAGPRNFGGPCFSDLFFFVSEPLEATTAIDATRVFYSAAHALVLAHNPASDPVDALAYTVYGFGKGFIHHFHRNGLAMELYGRGRILGIDPGRGPAYASAQHLEFNAQVGAHNAVVAHGQPAAADAKMDLAILAAEPPSATGDVPVFALSPQCQFTEVAGVLMTPLGGAEQRRVNGIVRTGPQTGYYVDIFRSRMQNGDETTHDYLYHNVGRSVTLADADGKPLPLESTALDPLSGPGYGYYRDAKALDTSHAWTATFDVGMDDIAMKVWMVGEMERTVYTLGGPDDCRDLEALPKLKDVRMKTLLVRQQGEAWRRPFVAVYEPSGHGVAPAIARVRRMEAESLSDDVVALAVESANGRVDRILNSTETIRKNNGEGVVFAGHYAVVTTINGEPDQLYLGSGTHLAFAGCRLESADGQPVQAVLYREGTSWCYRSTRDIHIGLPGGEVSYYRPSRDAAVV